MNRFEVPSEALTMDLGFPKLKAHVIDVTGLAYYLDKDFDLADKVGKRLAALNLGDCSTYLARLRDGQAGEIELDELVTDLTIGETYFFRHQEQFDALRQTILPDILRRNAARRQIRIWSAGCATGAEVYSISILLRREFAGQLAGWDVSILGTDINRKFLAGAREGHYGQWALRSTTEEIKASCFERSANLWRIRDPYRSGVSFQYHNLVKHPYPSLFHNLAAFDLILCRNVMIYFGHQAIAHCADRFWSSLVEGGWLLVGHAEVNRESFRAFHTVSSAGTVLFERRREPPEQPIHRANAGAFESFPPSPASWQAPPLPDRPALPTRSTIVPAIVDTKTGQDGSLATRIRELADQAQWAGAEALCLKMIDEDKLNPVGHFYQGLVLEQTGKGPAAESALGRAIYLDREFVLAHYHKGLLLQKGEDLAGAVRSFRNVVSLVRSMDPGRTFAEGDGISAGDLAELAQMQLAVLEGT